MVKKVGEHVRGCVWVFVCASGIHVSVSLCVGIAVQDCDCMTHGIYVCKCVTV